MFGADSITGGAYVDPVQLKWLSADNALQEGTATAGGTLATDLQQEEGISGLLAATPTPNDTRRTIDTPRTHLE